jgi:hypothetical protein
MDTARILAGVILVDDHPRAVVAEFSVETDAAERPLLCKSH